MVRGKVLGYKILYKEKIQVFRLGYGAEYGARTRYLNLGKVALYQMS